MLSRLTGAKEIIDETLLVLIIDLMHHPINVDLEPLRVILHKFCKIFSDMLIFETIVKAHNEKTIDHAKLQTKQQK